MSSINSIQPLQERKFDYFFILIFSYFCATSFLIDIPYALNIFLDWPLPTLIQAALENYINTIDPMLAKKPAFLVFAMSFSGFIWGPVYVYFIHGFISGNNQIKNLALIYAGAMSMAMATIFSEAFFPSSESWRPLNYSLFISLNSPYLFVPLLLMLRMRKAQPFS